MPVDSALQEAIEAFLHACRFAKVLWEDGELTAFNEAGEPFGLSEFVEGSPTRNHFLKLEAMFRESPST